MNSSDPLDKFCGSSFWYEDAYYNTTRLPNLTPCFQYTVMVWTPALFFWILAPFLTFQFILMNRLKKFDSLPWQFLIIFKFTLTLISIVVSLLLFFKFLFTSNTGAVHIWYPLIRATTMIGILIMQFASKRVGLVSSGIIFNVFLLHFICSLPEAYGWYERILGQRDSFNSVYNGWAFTMFLVWFLSITIQTIAQLFADKRDKNSEKLFGDFNRSPELDSSFVNRISLWWFNYVPVMGSKKDLTVDDLFELNKENKSEFLLALWDHFWQPKIESYIEKKRKLLADGTSTHLLNEKLNGASANGKSHVKEKDKPKVTKPSVVYNLYEMFQWQLWSSGLIKAFADVLQFANPFLLKKLLEFVSDPNAHLWQGICYAILMFLASELRSLCVNYYFYIMFRMGAKIQIALTGAVYSKTLRLSNSARRDRTVGEIVNVMAIDIERFQLVTSQIQQYWSSPFQITLALIFLFNTLGLSALPGVFIMITFIPMSFLASFLTRSYITKQMKLKDQRTKLINEILNGIKVIKLYSWEVPMMEEIEKIRKQELRCNVISQLIRSVLDVYNFSTPFLVALFSFMAYTLINSEESLTPQIAFVSLTLFNQLRSPMTMVGLLINMTVQAMVSNKRLKDLLTADEVDAHAVDRATSTKDSDDSSVKVDNADFAWENDSTEPNLQDLNMNVKKGSLIAVVGKVGSGKSSLLSALLGEMEKLRGYVGVRGQVAYVPQQAWIQNMSLRDNITFGRNYVRSFYNKVVDMCALKSDLAILQRGDQTEIGEKGINLSGGQKARVSLARAVYQNADVYLLDDPLSAVDSHVGRHLFDKVIGPKGLLRNKTRILVTHGITFLKDVDMIVHVDEGRILEMGSYEELLQNDQKFADLIAEVEKEKISNSASSASLSNTPNETPRSGEDEFEEYDDTNISIIEQSADLDSATQLSRQLSTISTLARRPCSLRQKTPPLMAHPDGKQNGVVTLDTVENADKDKLIQAESIQTGRVKMGVYLIYMKSASFWLSLFFILFYISYTGFQLGRNIWLSEWSDANDKGKHDTVSLGTRLGVYAALGVIEALSFAIALVALIFGSLRASQRLHGPMLHQILRAPMAFFDTTPLGRILNRFDKFFLKRDVDTIDVQLPMNFRYFLMCLTNVASTVLIICISTPVFIVPAIILTFVYYYALKFYVPTSRQLRRLESNYRSPIYSHFSESIQGVTSIRAFGKSQEFCLISNELVDTFVRVKYLSLVANRWLGLRLELLGNLVTFFTALFAALSNEFGFVSSAGLIGLAVSYALNITETLNFAVRQVSELETNIVSVERLKEYSEVESEAEWVLKDHRPKESWPDNGAVSIENYATRYRPGLDLVVKNITAEIKPTQKVGIVGRTGAGKSSLTLALFRMIEPAEGKIVIDGVNISDIGLHDLRSNITIIPQEPVLFSGSLRFNLDPFNKFSDADLWQSLEMAHLKNFASNLAEGLDHKITEGGENISVGQRQLVCLARALLRRSKVLVLDEATASVDVSTDALIQETIRREFANSSVFTIAHRLNTILDYDIVMVLDKGEIVEFAPPNQLLADRNSIFSQMVNQQEH